MAEKFQHNIEQFKQRLEARRPSVEAEASAERREEMVRGEISEFIEEFQKALPPVAAPPREVKQKATGLAALPPSQKLGALITMAFEAGLEEAISVARVLDEPALLDEFHDILVDSFYKELVEREIIKIP